MGYYNYHAAIKKRILSGEKYTAEFVERYKNISPCLLISFCDNVYPVREYRFDEYIELFEALRENKEKIQITEKTEKD